MDLSFDSLPNHVPPHEAKYEREQLQRGLEIEWNENAYRAYACAALTGVFNMPELRDMLAEIAHPDCDHDRYVAMMRVITCFVGNLADRMEFEERVAKATCND